MKIVLGVVGIGVALIGEKYVPDLLGVPETPVQKK